MVACARGRRRLGLVAELTAAVHVGPPERLGVCNERDTRGVLPVKSGRGLAGRAASGRVDAVPVADRIAAMAP